MSLLEMKNIKKSFDGQVVLKDISLSVENRTFGIREIHPSSMCYRAGEAGFRRDQVRRYLWPGFPELQSVSSLFRDEKYYGCAY